MGSPCQSATRRAVGTYVPQSPDVDSILEPGTGHDSHPDDIIPRFEYERAGGVGNISGQELELRSARRPWLRTASPQSRRDADARVRRGPTRGLVAHFGYRSGERSAVTIDIGPAICSRRRTRTAVSRSRSSRAHTTTSCALPFSGSLEWRLAVNSVTASADSRRCGRLDPDRQGARSRRPTRAASTSCWTANRASHRGRQRGHDGDDERHTGRHAAHGRRAGGRRETNLANYTTTIICRDNGGSGAIVAQGTGTSLAVTVRAGQAHRLRDLEQPRHDASRPRSGRLGS